MKIEAGKLYHFYLGIVSFVAIVAIGINFGIVLTSVGKYFFISDDEYLQNVEYYKLEQCENMTTYNNELKVENPVKRTPEEIATCKENVKVSVIASRSYDLKNMFIGSGAWTIVFVFLFFFHYPKFLKLKD